MKRPPRLGLLAVAAWTLAVAAVCAQDTGRGASQSGDQAAGSEVSLAVLLAGQPRHGDPDLEELRAMLSELRGRPGAQALASLPMERAAETIERVRQLSVQRADPARVARAKQIAWAALSLADRVLALAAADSALHEAQAHALRARAQAQQAEHARLQLERELAQALELAK